MDFLSEMLPGLVGMVTALGGFEAVKWITNRKSNSRIAEAEADIKEVHADQEEFAMLKEQMLFYQEQIREKEKRFAEQTEVVRKLNSREIELTQEVGRLKLELAMKRCEVKKCPQREPQTGY